MTTYEVRYGGKQGTSHALVLSDDHLVVRTHVRTTPDRAPLAQPSRKQLTDLEQVVEFPVVGVSVHRGRGPHDHAVNATQNARITLKTDPEVRFAGKSLVESASGDPVIYTENLFIKFDADLTKAACEQLLASKQLRVKRELDYAKHAYFVEPIQEGIGREIFGLALELLDDEQVELCHPETIRLRGDKAVFPQQWHLRRSTVNGQLIDQHVNVEDAWKLSQGEGITIAVIDDGIDIDHEEFAGSWKIVAPRDVTRKTNNPRPGDGDHHGTACAGVACANGTHGASGVAPKAKLMPIRLASGLGSQAEADAFMWAAQHGADVISCSWGPRDGRWWDETDPTHQQVVALPDSTRLAIDWAVEHGRNGKGCVITWAAGNGNESVDNDGYAKYPRVIAVAACNDMGTRSAYSDVGRALWCCFPSSHGYPSKTPGIWTTDRMGAAGYNVGVVADGDAEGDYANDFGGTSSACPGAAGVAALVLARNPELRWDQVKEVLRQACERIDTAGGDYNAEGHSSRYGYGRLNAARAAELAAPPRPSYRVAHTAHRDVAIVDLQTVELALEIGEAEPVVEVFVGVDIEHTYRGDLIVKLHAPPGLELAPITLHDGEGGAAQNLKRSFDAASTPRLAELKGRALRGTWKLSIHDRYERDQGTLRSFTIEACY